MSKETIKMAFSYSVFTFSVLAVVGAIIWMGDGEIVHAYNIRKGPTLEQYSKCRFIVDEYERKHR